MRGTAIAQGLKSLASKLHPQLPLSPKESQRLLTALTASFRKQLDQAHPQRAGPEESILKRGNGDVSKPGAAQLHSSSAAFADRHLASVLTNPLLAKAESTKKPNLDLVAAKIELQKNPAKDPISLLEEYDQKGAATVPIASLCLETFKLTLENLPEDKRQAEIFEAKAGKRVLLWLWNSKMYETDAFVEDLKFMEVLTFFIVKEASETYFWEWWQMDMRLGNQVQPRPGLGDNRRYTYRWKGRMLRNLIKAKLNESKETSANAALETFLYACDIKEAAIRQGVKAHQYPLHAAVVLLQTALERSPKIRKNTDPDLFDQFIERSALYTGEVHRTEGQEERPSGFRQYQEGRLWLYHPRGPSPLPALRFLKYTFATKSGFEGEVTKYFTKPRDERQMYDSWVFMIRTAALLGEHAREEDANWVLALARQLFPQQDTLVEENMNRIQKGYRTESGKASGPAREETPIIPRRIPFPSFG